MAGNSLNNILETILSIHISLIHSSLINTYLLSIYYVSGTILDTSEQVKVPVLMGDPPWGERGNAPVHRVLVALSQGPAGTTRVRIAQVLVGPREWYGALLVPSGPSGEFRCQRHGWMTYPSKISSKSSDYVAYPMEEKCL